MTPKGIVDFLDSSNRLHSWHSGKIAKVFRVEANGLKNQNTGNWNRKRGSFKHQKFRREFSAVKEQRLRQRFRSGNCSHDHFLFHWRSGNRHLSTRSCKFEEVGRFCWLKDCYLCHSGEETALFGKHFEGISIFVVRHTWVRRWITALIPFGSYQMMTFKLRFHNERSKHAYQL